MPSPRIFCLLLALLACACAGVVAGCGGDDSVDEVLAETFGEDKQIRSGRMDLSVRVDAQGVPQLTGPVAIRLAGPFESTGNGQLPRFAFDLGFEGGGQSLQAGAVSTGESGFLRFAGEAYDIGPALFRQFRDGYAEQARCDDGRESSTTLGALGIDPRSWLRDAQDAGTEEVGGVETTHVRARVDVPRFLEDVNRVLGRAGAAQRDPCERGGGAAQQPPARLSDEERRVFAQSVREARIDVWSGDEDRIMRRVNVLLRFALPEGVRPRSGLRSGAVRFDLSLGALNEDQDIRAPAGAKPIGDLAQRYGGTLPFPGLPGGGGGAGG